MTHVHELRGGLLEGMVGIGWRGQRKKSWDNCNNIINKVYLHNKCYVFDRVVLGYAGGEFCDCEVNKSGLLVIL